MNYTSLGIASKKNDNSKCESELNDEELSLQTFVLYTGIQWQVSLGRVKWVQYFILENGLGWVIFGLPAHHYMSWT